MKGNIMRLFSFIAIMLILLEGCSMVPPGSRGVRTILGGVSEDLKAPGFYLWFPFLLGMTKIDVRIQKSTIESTAATKDMQDVHAHVAINWSLTDDRVINTYKTIGDEEEVEQRILIPAVNEIMKSSSAKLTAEEVLTKRLLMKQDIDEGLMKRLQAYGITLHDVSIVDLRFSEEFTKAIEEKQIAEQEAKKAEYTAKQAIQEAIAEVEHAKGQAKAQELLRSSLTKEILQQKAIDKWDGKFPLSMGSNSIPFLHLNQMIEK